MIKYFIMDVDGTLTDGKIYLSENGEVFKSFCIKDGYGIKNILIPNNITPIVVTGRKSKIVELRCKELNIKYLYQNCDDKLQKILELTNDLSYVAYIGDDDNDLNCILEVNKHGGVTACPNNASSKIKNNSQYVLNNNGGNGAVREFIDIIINAK